MRYAAISAPAVGSGELLSGSSVPQSLRFECESKGDNRHCSGLVVMRQHEGKAIRKHWPTFRVVILSTVLNRFWLPKTDGVNCDDVPRRQIRTARG